MKAHHQQFCMVFLAVMVIAAGAASQALGVSYNVIELHPSSGFSASEAIGASGTQQVGYGRLDGTYAYRHALLWNGSASRYADLHPGGFNESQATGTYNKQQVGYGHDLGSSSYHAYLWNGSAASCVDLHPSGFPASCATGTNGMQQVGCGGDFMIDLDGNIVDVSTRALLWNGSAESYFDLNPSGFYSSVATGISGTQQVGWGRPSSSSNEHALLWSGSAASYANLHPNGFYNSFANGTSGTQQVGMGRPSSESWNHALLWSGTAESYVDLHPSGVAESCANGTNGTHQVGWGLTYVPSAGEYLKRAMVWNGSATDFFYLPIGGFFESWASGIDDYGNIVGCATYGTGHTYAILWQPVPEPATVSLLALGGLALLGRRRRS